MEQVYTTKNKGEQLTIVCRSESTRNGFRHICNIYTDCGASYGYPMSNAKINYANRTWERYGFESVIHRALNGCKFTADDKENQKQINRIMRTIDRKALGY